MRTDRETGAFREFIAEAEEVLEELYRDVTALSAVTERHDDPPPDLINAIFRSAHSLKGLAGMVGCHEISGLAHHLESFLDLLRLGKISLESGTVTTLWDGVDLLGLLIRSHATGQPPPDCSAVVTQLTGILPRGSAVSAPEPLARPDLPARITGALTEFEEHRLSETIRKGRRLALVHVSLALESFDREIEALLGFLKERGEVISTLPSPGRANPDAIDFTILVGWDLPPADLPAAVTCEEVPLLPVAEPAAGESAPAPPPASLPLRDDAASSARSLSGTVRVDIARLDELMAIVGELMACHTVLEETLMRSSGMSSAESALMTRSSRRLGAKLNELQYGVMDLRLIPVRTLYDKMARIVRKITAGTGQEPKLVFIGAETRLDKQIVEDISDPLMHLIRNAVDHGIEPPDERVAAGKEPSGKITISAAQRGNRIIIEITDDGRGIEVDRVRRRARERGLVGYDETISDAQALEYIFLPGFSTSENVSELSGRGVGLDVVKNNIMALSGQVTIATEPGQGSRVTISLPITLAIIKTLIVGSGKETYGVPVSAIQETVAVDSGHITTIEGNEVLPVRELVLPLIRLGWLFGTDTVTRPDEGYAIVAGTGDRRVGIMVDELRGQQDLVLSSLGALLAEVPGIAGAANLGEESTILILDVAAIVDEACRGTISHVS